ncbi:hypothetical protein [Pedobacter boryungensis]|uniref:DUF3828 domain-containing protein n=1 Tax=Pedobacter boryungensis TaxID=869962 RepID=A0ABX2D940_9SPHI|nr:hypothetical protein [Pedobacter boryungensis]NQX30495.1 hypothetical protein [Pedobacter boryungensis]
MKTNILIIALSFSVLFNNPTAITIGKIQKEQNKIQNQATVTPEQTVRSFIFWYSKNMQRLNNIQLVNQLQAPAKPYYVNKANVAIYLAELKKSGFLSNKFLNSIEHYIGMCNENLLKTKQIEGPPEGFDMDMILLTQDYESNIKLLNQGKITRLTKNKVRFTFDSEDFLVFSLSQGKGKWLIDSIE